MESIIQKRKECLVCQTTLNLEKHHIFGGVARRDLSEKYGLTVWLCHEHHTGNTGVHSNKQFMDDLHELGQTVFSEVYGDQLFFERFGRNYLKGDKEDDNE